MGCVTRERMATEKEQKMMGRGPGSAHSLPCPPNLFLSGPGLTPPDKTPTPWMLLERQEKKTFV